MWDAPLLQTALIAGGLGLSVFLRLNLFTERGPSIIEEHKSEDGSVTATIEDQTNRTGKLYLAKVKRIYQAGVFAKEDQFDTLQEAKDWLMITYRLELDKHQQHLREQ